MTTEPAPTPRRRPFTLTVVSLLLLVRAALLIGLLVLMLTGGISEERIGLLSDIDLTSGVIEAAGLGGAYLVSALGLWALRPWAWRLAMITLGVNLLIGLWLRYTEGPEFILALGLALDIFIVFYLVQGDVRALFTGNQTAGGK